ncbi:HAD family acid phosphatase [Streptomyces sp. Da 82-17]|uniref:HAD family acid phosphatase n=1 Tax=Streptomyces sp. Da 82-17 TaxID=3377116 RepID=UPI0038D50269
MKLSRGAPSCPRTSTAAAGPTEGKQAFDDELWDAWVRENGPTPTPGAVEFTHYAKERGVEVFYVSSRDQGPDTHRLGVANLRHAGPRPCPRTPACPTTPGTHARRAGQRPK